MIIAVDFDGTIVEDRFPNIGEPIADAFDTLLFFMSQGHKLILWTCREDTPGRKYLSEAVEFCRARGVEFEAVNENIHGHPFSHLGAKGRKVYADVYIDDRSQYPLWEMIGDLF
ncbi:MAG: hypothetical protein RBU23_12835 [Candidatus Auribacterota bacterium]|jgi:hypothetical protein|nr:hypothetical protein [Candidatus Auribacterota bacterium]